MLVRVLHPLHFLKEIFNFDILDRICSSVFKYQQASFKM